MDTQSEVDSPIDTSPDPEPDPEPDLGEDIPEEEPLPVERCGNSLLEAGEECDDGDTDDCNGCSSTCEWERSLQVAGTPPGARVDIPDVPCLTIPFTIELWFRLDRSPASLSLFDIPGTAALSIGTFGAATIFVTGYRGGSAPSSPIAAGTWHHVAITCYFEDGFWNGYRFYDGVFWGYLGGYDPIPILGCDEPMSIGDYYYLSDSDFLVFGTIDDIRISSEALYTELGGPYAIDRHLDIRPDTVALWDFDQEVDGVIPDVSGNGHDAVLVGGTLVPDDCHMP
jgi:cysteine-rich repeat protein